MCVCQGSSPPQNWTNYSCVHGVHMLSILGVEGSKVILELFMTLEEEQKG